MNLSGRRDARRPISGRGANETRELWTRGLDAAAGSGGWAWRLTRTRRLRDQRAGLCPASFAAAFISFLKARTFCKDSSLVTSATE
jgi:hypothetical protein